MKEITLTDLKQLEKTALDTLNNINNEKIKAGFKEIEKLHVNKDIGVNIMHPYNKMVISKIFVFDKDIAVFFLFNNKIKKIHDIDSLYGFLKSFQKALKSFKPTVAEKEKQAYKNILNYIYKLLKYEYIRRVTKKIEDSKISTCVTIEDMRKKLLKDIKDKKQYKYLVTFLNFKTNPTMGLELYSHKSRDNTVKEINKIMNKLNIQISLNLIDNQLVNIEKFLSTVKNAKKTQDDNLLRDFLYYIQKVVSIEYKNRISIDKRRFYKTFPNKQLFVNDLPTIENVKQGQLGDCYLLAALISIIKKDAKLIKKCFLNKEYNPETKYVKIKLYRVEVHVIPTYDKNFTLKVLPLNPIVIQVDNTVLIKKYKTTNGDKNRPFGNRTNALWVNFIEKAFSVYKNIKDAVVAADDLAKIIIEKWTTESDHSLSGQNANSGFEFIPFCAITGKKSSSKSVKGIQNILLKYNDVSFQFDYSSEENKVFNYIDQNLKKFKVLTASTYSESERTFDQTTRKNMGLYPTHAYSIDSTIINQGQRKKYIVLYNPHMAKELIDPESTLAVAGTSPKEMKKGKIKCELSDFIHYFKDINKVSLGKV